MVSLKDMARSDAERAPPTWLRTLLQTTFFDACPEHPASEGLANKRATGCNFFCTRCADRALCSGCLGTHEGHELIQIRKHSGHNAVKVGDVQHLLNVSLVQTYLYKNGDRVVFLNRRPTGQGSHIEPHCEECERGLLDEARRFCSLGCKAEAIEDRLDFSISFAVNPNNNSSGGSVDPNNNSSMDETEAVDEEDSSSPSEFQN